MEIFGAIGNEGLFPQPEQGSLLSPIFRPALSSPLRPFHCSRPCRQQRQKKALRLPNPNDGRFWSPMAKTNVLNPTKGRSWCARTVPKKNDTGYPRPSGTRKRKRRRIMPRPGQRSSRITRMRRGWGARTAVRGSISAPREPDHYPPDRPLPEGRILPPIAAHFLPFPAFCAVRSGIFVLP